jgi:Ni/Co efflux regulator RcnB
VRNKHAAAPQAGHFEERHSVLVRDYYEGEMRGGRCPPGLAKKQNGCMPPGQAKKWNVGKRLPAGVIYHTVPQPLVTQIGAPPAGYRYIRVGNDILMISSGTGVIIDAIANFGRS